MKVNAKKLKVVLNNLKPGLSGSKETTEQSSCFAFTNERIHTYNDEISVSVPNPIDFVGVVSSRKFLALINKMKSEEIHLLANGDELTVKAGRLKAGIVLQEEILMPIDEIIIPKKWHALPEDLLKALENCIFSAAPANDISVLNNIYCSDNTVQSSDNERATRCTLSSNIKTPFLIPANSAKDLIRTKDIVEYSFDEEWAHFRTSEDVVFSCRCSYEEYPDMNTYFSPDGFPFVFPKETKDILEKTEDFTKMDTRLVQISITSRGILSMRAEGDSDWIEESKRIRSSPNSDIQFSINPQYLLQMLKETHSATIGSEMIWFTTEEFEHVVALENK